MNMNLNTIEIANAYVGKYVRITDGENDFFAQLTEATEEGVKFLAHIPGQGLNDRTGKATFDQVFAAGRTCSHCKDDLDLSEFNRNKNSVNGHHAICKLCNKGKTGAAARGEEFIPESRYYVEDGTNKQCTKCKQWKWEEDFNVDRSRPDGLTSQCKECRRAARRKR